MKRLKPKSVYRGTRQAAPAKRNTGKAQPLPPASDMHMQLLDLSPSTEVGIIAFFLSLPFLGMGTAILGLGETSFFVVAVTATGIGVGTKCLLSRANIQEKLGLHWLHMPDWSVLLGHLSDVQVVEGSISPSQELPASGEEEEPSGEEQTEAAAIPGRESMVPPGRSKPFFRSYPEDQALHLGAIATTGQRFDPWINAILGQGVFCAGSPGAGKSNLAAVVGEQGGACCMSEVFFDLKREYHTLIQTVPNGIRAGHPDYAAKAGAGYYSLTTENAAQFAADVMEYGFQAIIDIPSYKGDYGTVAQVMAGVLNGLMDWAEEQPPDERHNCLIGIDEAHNYFPERLSLSAMKIKPEHFDLSQRAFSRITNLGRSYGYTVALFTQRIANIAKSAIANCQIKIIMRHSLDIDVKRCEEEAGCDGVTRQTIKRLERGHGIVIGLTDEPVIVRFDLRQSEHVSHTPDISRSHQRFKKGYQRLSRVLAERIPDTAGYRPAEPAGQGSYIQENGSLPIPTDENQRKLTRYHRLVLEHYRPGIPYRELGDIIGVGKDKAGDLIKELRKWGFLKDDALSE